VEKIQLETNVYYSDMLHYLRLNEKQTINNALTTTEVDGVKTLSFSHSPKKV